MLDFVLWSIVVALMPVAMGLVRALLSSIGSLLGARLARSRGGQETRTYISPRDSTRHRVPSRVLARRQDDSCSQTAGTF
jgi:hypothetical protein